ncbi:hypothetical protein AAFF_G00297090 [Aldrovandia affinis]|uniref:NADH dehydrogenase [ubiquinone] 1 beta subcomplex subunit 8, mitochondrial n=1 Tax=Aldrovandia affinis TaxID=143900 RepID=A0AAD7SQI4_9TELE|nr:hypothetical protein AAFF_G00297090 [Aldrovandia affinis]
MDMYGDLNFTVLGFPCNQFGLQAPEGNHETLNVLRYVRPGGGFVPKFPIFGKLEVNGLNEESLFTYLKESLPYINPVIGDIKNSIGLRLKSTTRCVLRMRPSAGHKQCFFNMALLGVSRWARALSKGNRPSTTALISGARTASGVSKDTMPGPYPKTPEERAAAARKYNMRVEDYEPYPEDGMGFGDYPKLPDRSQHERDPWYSWDHPDLRRNWGEPMHWDFDMFIRNRVDTSPSPVDWSTMCKHLFGFFGFMFFMIYLGEKFPSYQPVAPKQYPYNNLHLEKGGDPDKLPEEVKHYEI